MASIAEENHASATAVPKSKFGDYHVVTTTYKSVTSESGTAQPLKVDVWLPPSTRAITKPHPVILFLHGGGLVLGHRAFTEFINGWLATFAEKNNAVVVSPDYRLIPESTGVDIIDDVEDFWSWVNGGRFESGPSESLLGFLSKEAPDLILDLDRILVTGGSAGGYLATHLCLSHSSAQQSSQIKALLLQYPLVDIDSPWTHGGFDDPRNGGVKIPWIDPLPREKLDEIEAKAKEMRTKGEIVSEAGFERTPWVVTAQYYGRWGTWIMGDKQARETENGGPRDPVIFNRIKKGKCGMPKRIFLLHGTKDSAVPVYASKNFVALVSLSFPKTEVQSDYREGLEHGYDGEITDDKTIWQGLNWAAEEWLK